MKEIVWMFRMFPFIKGVDWSTKYSLVVNVAIVFLVVVSGSCLFGDWVLSGWGVLRVWRPMSPHRLGDRGCLWPVGWLRGSWGRRARRCPEAASATASPRPMHPAAAAGRCLSSVSDLCGVDEIDALLDEIRDLEPASCCPEEFQVSSVPRSSTSP